MARSSNYRGQSKNRMNSRTRPKQMLNIARMDYFKYDLNEIMERSKMDEDMIGPFTATMTARARQRSIKEAKDYIREVQERGDISQEISEQLFRLLDRYSKYR